MSICYVQRVSYTAALNAACSNATGSLYGCGLRRNVLHLCTCLLMAVYSERLVSTSALSARLQRSEACAFVGMFMEVVIGHAHDKQGTPARYVYNERCDFFFFFCELVVQGISGPVV